MNRHPGMTLNPISWVSAAVLLILASQYQKQVHGPLTAAPALLESFPHTAQLVIVFDQKIHVHVGKKFLLAGNLKLLQRLIGVWMKSAIIKVAGFQNSVNNII